MDAGLVRMLVAFAISLLVFLNVIVPALLIAGRADDAAGEPRG